MGDVSPEEPFFETVVVIGNEYHKLGRMVPFIIRDYSSMGYSPEDWGYSACGLNESGRITDRGSVIEVGGTKACRKCYPSPQRVSPGAVTFGRKITLRDLLEAGRLEIGDQLEWTQPLDGSRYRASITQSGIRLADGREFSSPTEAASAAAGKKAANGWYAWRVERTGLSLHGERFLFFLHLRPPFDEQSSEK